MTNQQIQGSNQNAAVTTSAFVPSKQSNAVSADFRTLLGKMYNRTISLVQSYADPEVTEINLEGFGTFKDKSSPAFQMASALYISNNEAQLNTTLGIFDFLYKTLPQMLEKSIG